MYNVNRECRHNPLVAINSCVESTKYPLPRHWDPNESWYKVSLQRKKRAPLLTMSGGGLTANKSIRAKECGHVHRCTPKLPSRFVWQQAFKLLSVSARFSVQCWHPKFKPVKPGLLPAPKPEFTGLKTGGLDGFSGTPVAFHNVNMRGLRHLRASIKIFGLYYAAGLAMTRHCILILYSIVCLLLVVWCIV